MMPRPVCWLEFGWFANLGGLLKIMSKTQQFGFLPRPGHNLKPNWKSCLAISGRDRNGRVAHNADGVTIPDESEERIDFFTQKFSFHVIADLASWKWGSWK